MARRRGHGLASSTAGPFVSLRTSKGAPGRWRLATEKARLRLSVRSDRDREIAFRIGPVEKRAIRGTAAEVPRRWKMGGLELRVAGDPPSLTVLDRGRVVFETATELPPGKLPGPTPWGLREKGITWPFRIGPDERIYGAGEFFGPVNHVGQELRTSIRDVFGLPNDGTYVAYPFFWSTRGYAFLAETWAPVRFDFGCRYLGLGEFEIPIVPVTVRLFFSRDPREILRWFWDRRGAPAIPPLWSYGIWYSRCAYRSQRELLRVARKVRSLGLPGDVIHLDPPWLDEPLPDALYAVGRRLGLPRGEVDRSSDQDPGDVLAGLAGAAKSLGIPLPFYGVGCTFRWNRRRFPDPSKMIRELHDRQFHLSLWVNPYVPAHTREHRYLRRRDLFTRLGDGRVGLQFDGPSVDFGGVDFSRPEGRKWFADRVRDLLHLGVDVIKTDFGEAIPEDGYGGTLGAPELHNRYSTWYNETVFRALRSAGREPMVWGRSGGLDIHRYPVQWGGDPRTYPRDMGAALRGALSYAASGGAFMAFDSGGFWGRPTPELYIRWMQMGMLFSHIRLHGTTPREPWEYGRDALAVFRKFSALRYRLIPYLYSQSVEGIRLGRPLVRSITIDFPDDPAAHAEDEYLLGEHLLVVPVVPGARVQPKLPRGRWFDFWTGECAGVVLDRGRAIPLDQVPLFVRDGAVLPMTSRDHDHVSPSMLEDLVLRVYGSARSVRLDFGRYGRLAVRDLSRREGRSGRFHWKVERATP